MCPAVCFRPNTIPICLQCFLDDHQKSNWKLFLLICSSLKSFFFLKCQEMPFPIAQIWIFLAFLYFVPYSSEYIWVSDSQKRHLKKLEWIFLLYLTQMINQENHRQISCSSICFIIHWQDIPVDDLIPCLKGKEDKPLCYLNSEFMNSPLCVSLSPDMIPIS